MKLAWKTFDFSSGRRGYVTVEGDITLIHYTSFDRIAITEIFFRGKMAVEIRLKKNKCEVIQYIHTPEMCEKLKEELEWLPEETEINTKIMKEAI
jgi:hypothetical protein